MSRLLIMSDLHLGHKNICRYRSQFSSEEEHSETLFDNLATALGKRDSLILLGDVAFSKEWVERIGSLKCVKKTLVVGNHDLEFGIHMKDLVLAYDQIYSLYSSRNAWWSHCPIHPDELRKRAVNIHGHTHNHVLPDDRYFNACVEHTNYKPITFEEIKECVRSRGIQF